MTRTKDAQEALDALLLQLAEAEASAESIARGARGRIDDEGRVHVVGYDARGEPAQVCVEWGQHGVPSIYDEPVTDCPAGDHAFGEDVDLDEDDCGRRVIVGCAVCIREARRRAEEAAIDAAESVELGRRRVA